MSTISRFYTYVVVVEDSLFLMKGTFCFRTGTILVPVDLELVPGFGWLQSPHRGLNYLHKLRTWPPCVLRESVFFYYIIVQSYDLELHSSRHPHLCSGIALSRGESYTKTIVSHQGFRYPHKFCTWPPCVLKLCAVFVEGLLGAC